MGRKTALILFLFFAGCMQAEDPTKIKSDECEVACDSKNKIPPDKNQFSDYELCLVSCDGQKIYIYIKEEHEKENR